MKIEFNPEIISIANGEFSMANEMFPDLSKLAPLFPKNFNILENSDVFPHVVPLAVANRFNRNGVGIDSEGAKQILQKLSYKYIDYEHDNSNIIGNILNVGFSDVETDEIFEGESDDAFYINCAGILFKSVNPRLIERIAESSSMTSPTFGEYSASWEVRYSDYNIALGSAIMKDCEIISDPKQVQDFSKHLKIKGGSGFTPDGIPVYQQLAGNLTPIGIGVVRRPAAYVKGIYGIGQEEKPAYASDSAKKIFDMAANTSQLSDAHVNLNRTDMDKEIVDLLTQIREALKKGDGVEQTSVASITQLLQKTIEEKAGEWQVKFDAEKKRADDEVSSKAALQTTVTDLTDKLAQAQAQIDQLTQKVAQSEASDLFSARMEKIDTAFKLDDELRAIVTADLKALATDEASFNSYFDRTKVLLKGKEKTAEDNKKEEVTLASVLGDKVVDAKVSFEDLKTLLSSAQVEITNIPNSTDPTAGSLKERFKDAFGKDDIKVEYSK